MSQKESIRNAYLAAVQMSNILYNLKQMDVPDKDNWELYKASMEYTLKQWDANSNELSKLLLELISKG